MALIHSRKLWGCVAAAIAAIAAFTSPAPAQADPVVPLAPNDCAGYQFPGGTVTLHYPNIGQTVFDTTVPSTHVDTKATTNYPNGSSMQGSVTGDINGRKIHLTVTREGYTPLVLDGEVGADNRGHGTYTYRNGADSGNWDSLEELGCVAAPAAPPVAQQPNLPYGPDTCVEGLVWREARPGDNVCVRPTDRDRTASENATAADRRDPRGAYGPNSCKPGFVWREAFDGDAVCVTPDTRRENLDWNNYDRGTVLGAQRHQGYGLPYPSPPNDIG
jgi:hypothetical protein